MLHTISVSVVYAERDKQWLYSANVPRGTNASELIERSGFVQDVPALAEKTIDEMALSVYAQKIKPDYLLEEGDRVEILRPLTADPKTVRRELAKLGKTMAQR